MNKVRPKKRLGQHFLKDENIAKKIVNSLTLEDYDNLLEVGPGTGVLTKHLLELKEIKLKVDEVDEESRTYLKENYAALNGRIIETDFLDVDLSRVFEGQPLAVIGNFPYNISTQIYFQILRYRNLIPESVGMIQREVAQRISSKHSNKTYGILSVLVQAFYQVEYLFEVSPSVFLPPPKVWSAVIRLKRKENFRLDCDENLFFRVVKQSFQTRRKTLRNALKSLNLPDNLRKSPVFDKRAEQLSVEDFIILTKQIEHAV